MNIFTHKHEEQAKDIGEYYTHSYHRAEKMISLMDGRSAKDREIRYSFHNFV